ncbi:hypothetical protein SERLA73DRAFT_182933 [Serpula lacrymans var. lacrymans S7.3]|uniref:Yeast cell wall synthesis Kre9/Knh1-like N-terminal domain-containing protein n=1 Tax=Serpula lacrymans var. lacrymans (strain S7.3) TaxID=936435 RepID=F8Q182_SERL3|nr:hypothetical protein SERLA73DRAFT_182933 [Serpula lacrymans var. lacrymans S7.3]
MHANIFTIFSIFLMIYASLDLARAVPLAKRDVVDPPITSPIAGTVWNVGETQTVTWNTSDIPSNPTTTTGMLILGYLANNSENLNLSSPLASGFKYTDGQVQITVPDVPTRSNYIIVLFGDSGNASPQFTINNGVSSSLSPTSSASSSGSASPSSTPSATPSSVPPQTSSPSSPTSSSVSSPASPPTTTSPISGSPSPTPTSAASSVSSAPTSSTPTSSTVTTTSARSPTQTQTNAAWRASRFNACSLVVVIASIALFS